jgi:hypothetical protein
LAFISLLSPIHFLALLGKIRYAYRQARTYQVAETTINMVDALRGQQAQLRRLLAQKVLIGDAPKTTLSEMQALVIELRRLLAELERAIQDQLQQGRK